jgi:hypothetical protein
MTAWSTLLLAGYVVLGLTGRTSWRNARLGAVALTATVMVAVFVSYGAVP